MDAMDSIHFYNCSKRCWKSGDSLSWQNHLGPRPLPPNPAIMIYWIVVYSLLDEIRFIFSFLSQKLRILLTRGKVLGQDFFLTLRIFWYCPLFTLYPVQSNKQDNQNAGIKVARKRKRKCQGINFLQVGLSAVSASVLVLLSRIAWLRPAWSTASGLGQSVITTIFLGLGYLS